MFKGSFTNKYNNNNNNDINRSAVAGTVAVSAGSDKKEAMLNGSFTGRYNSDISCSAAAGTVAVNAGDVKLQASMTDATFVSGPTFTDLSLSIEKPGSFLIDFNVPNKDFKFQFMDTVKIKEMPLNLTYTHLKGKNRTFLDGSLVINESNKVSANYAVDSGYCKLKYSYKHKGGTMIEPSYDFANSSWNLAVSQRFLDDDVLRASYETSSNNLGLEWSRKGTYKVSASLNLKEGLKMPRLSAENHIVIVGGTILLASGVSMDV